DIEPPARGRVADRLGRIPRGLGGTPTGAQGGAPGCRDLLPARLGECATGGSGCRQEVLSDGAGNQSASCPSLLSALRRQRSTQSARAGRGLPRAVRSPAGREPRYAPEVGRRL